MSNETYRAPRLAASEKKRPSPGRPPKRIRIRLSSAISAQDVVRIVAEVAGISVEDLHSQSRKRPIAWPRQMAYLIMRQRCPHLSYPQIGLYCGARDHTTVLYGVREARQRLEVVPEYAALYRRAIGKVDYLARKLRGCNG